MTNPAALQVVAPPTEKPDADTFFDALPTNGDAVGNVSLREKLGWQVDRYFQAREALLRQQKVTLGKGKGGSVRRRLTVDTLKAAETVAPPQAPAEAERAEVDHKARERDLYPQIVRAVDNWARDLGYSKLRFVVDISSQGSRRTGGKWTRPDIVMVSLENYSCIPGKNLEVITFEIKPAWSWGIEAVFEAASHSRFATKSYLVLHKNGEPSDAELLERIEDECRRFGVGLIVTATPDNFSENDFVIEPGDSRTDLFEMNAFLEEQLPEDKLDELRIWVK